MVRKTGEENRLFHGRGWVRWTAADACDGSEGADCDMGSGVKIMMEGLAGRFGVRPCDSPEAAAPLFSVRAYRGPAVRRGPCMPYCVGLPSLRRVQQGGRGKRRPVDRLPWGQLRGGDVFCVVRRPAVPAWFSDERRMGRRRCLWGPVWEAAVEQQKNPARTVPVFAGFFHTEDQCDANLPVVIIGNEILGHNAGVVYVSLRSRCSRA